ncbi:isoprenylcysteine carboxylmethyltransferase family protein [bacterium]|nr:isoprenylcysteine carboxylmethyltransferase family protein [bacterium]
MSADTTFNFSGHLFLAVGWVAWCVIHSLLISCTLKRKLHHWLGARYAYFRLFYVLLSVVTLLPLLWLQWTLESPMLFVWSFPASIVRWVGLGLALMILYLGARQYDQPFFFGIRQIQQHLNGEKAEFSDFTARGILARMRHPYYSGGILFLLFWGNFSVAYAITAGIGIAYLIIGAFIEERKLILEFGDAYREYQRDVPMFIPRLRIRR